MPDGVDMANEAEKRELVTKLNALARRSNGGAEPTPDTWQRLFARYDRDKDGRISAGELTTLLEDADIGNWLTRSGWSDNIVYEVDWQRGDKDGTVSLSEFMAVIKGIGDQSPWTKGTERAKDLLRGGDGSPSKPPPLPDAPAGSSAASSADGTGWLLLAGIGLLVLLKR